MKVKELIEELEKFNPDGTVEVEIIAKNGTQGRRKVEGVEDSGCALINPVIIARQ
jgi:hypothetical protein